MLRFILFTLLAAITTALPTGAPVCIIDESAPGSPHRVTRNGKPFRTGPLSDGGFSVTVGGTVLDTATPLALVAGTVYDVVFTSEDGLQPYRGVLGIVHSATYNFTTANFNTGTPDLQNSMPCSLIKGLAGVTHVSGSDKTSALAKFSVNANIDVVKFDVNIVVANNDNSGSIFYYTQYQLKVTGATNAPTPAPRSCGLLGLKIFCPFSFCGIFGRAILGPRSC
jgi:hypothetical protein